MVYHTDEKGKYFTEHISKKPLDVILQTQREIILGKIHLAPEQRLIDTLNTTKPFIAVTEATIFTAEWCRTDFMALNSDHIIWVTPLENVSLQIGFLKKET